MPRYTRRTKGRLIQARLWIGYEYGGSFNLGLFRTEGAAAKAVAEVLRRLRGDPNPLAVWEVVEPLLGTVIPEHVLPKWVVKSDRDPNQFDAKLGFVRCGPLPTPKAAVRVAMALKPILDSISLVRPESPSAAKSTEPERQSSSEDPPRPSKLRPLEDIERRLDEILGGDSSKNAAVEEAFEAARVPAEQTKEFE